MSTGIHNLLSDLWCPRVGVLTSDAVEECANINNLHFTDLLLPFSNHAAEMSIKDPTTTGALLPIRNLRVDFRDLQRDTPLSDKALHHLLHNLVKESVGSGWHHEYLESIITLSEGGEHELSCALVGVVIAVTSHEPNALDMLTQLSQKQHSIQHQKPKNAPESGRISEIRWFVPNIFKYYVLVHDVSKGGEESAEAMYQSMKMGYGAHACHLLHINSANPQDNSSSPDPWKACLHAKYRGLAQALIDNREDDTANIGQIQETIECNELPAQTELNELEIAIEEAIEPTDGSTVAPARIVRQVRSESIPHALSSNNITDMDKEIYKQTTNAHEAVVKNEDKLWKVDCSHGAMLTSQDRDRIQILVQELLARGLLPFVERLLRLLTEQAQNRKGLMGKIPVKQWSWWPKTQNAPSSPPANAVVYTPESSEMQMRRLADLAFLFHQYNISFQYYYTLKKDFMEAKAWLHYAGAAEMCAISAFMLGSSITGKPYPLQYMESAMTTYATTCLRPLLACRAALLSGEILTDLHMYSDAAAQLIRMTNGESQLSSAVFLEKAADCFLRSGMRRKYAFHMILAGHRYSKAGLSEHAIRTYLLAADVYAGREWAAIEDHIHGTVGDKAIDVGITPNNRKKHSSISCDDSEIERKINSDYGLNIKSPEISKSDVPKTNEQLISCNIKCKPYWTHDFSNSTPCTVDVNLILKNTCESTINIQIMCFAGQEAFSTPRRGASPLAYFGRTQQSFDIGSKQEMEIVLTGIIFTAGLFDVASFIVNATKQGQIISLHVPPAFMSVIKSV